MDSVTTSRTARFAPAARIGVLGACLVGACSSDQLPPGTTLRMAPEFRSTTVDDRSDADGNCVYDPGYYLDVPVVLSLTDSQGSPIGDADVHVSVDWSGNTFPGQPALALYDDATGNGNGVIDDDELVSGTGDDIAVVETDRYDGTRTVMMRTFLSCPFRGDVFAFAGSATALLSVEVTTESVTPPPEPVDEAES